MAGKMHPLFYLVVIALITSCKTSDQVQRDKLLENLSSQMVQMQKLSAEQNIRLSDIESRLARLSGSMEERNHSLIITTDDKEKKLQEDLEFLKASNLSTTEQLKKNQEELTAQKQYLEKVLATLGKMGGNTSSSKSKKLSDYDQAMTTYGKAQYKTAIKELTGLLNDSKIKGDKKARVYHNLGMSQFLSGNNEEAVVAFSKLLSEYPKYKFNPNGMLHLAKAFMGLKQNDAAKETLEELVKRYPKATQSQKAQELLKKLK